MTQAIQTRCLSATNTRPFRYKAWSYSGKSITLNQSSELEHVDNHKRAAEALMKMLKWNHKIVGGVLPNQDMCWVGIEE